MMTTLDSFVHELLSSTLAPPPPAPPTPYGASNQTTDESVKDAVFDAAVSGNLARIESVEKLMLEYGSHLNIADWEWARKKWEAARYTERRITSSDPEKVAKWNQINLQTEAINLFLRDTLRFRQGTEKHGNFWRAAEREIGQRISAGEKVDSDYTETILKGLAVRIALSDDSRKFGNHIFEAEIDGIDSEDLSELAIAAQAMDRDVTENNLRQLAGELSGVETSMLPRIVKEMRINGLPVTEDEIRKVYDGVKESQAMKADAGSLSGVSVNDEGVITDEFGPGK